VKERGGKLVLPVDHAKLAADSGEGGGGAALDMDDGEDEFQDGGRGDDVDGDPYVLALRVRGAQRLRVWWAWTLSKKKSRGCVLTSFLYVFACFFFWN
jgi:hypothetical protein